MTMARSKAVLGSGARLSHYLSASLLALVYPADQIEQVLDEYDVNSRLALFDACPTARA
jgi:hypothetical protein